MNKCELQKMIQKITTSQETAMQELKTIVSQLRDPIKGCPWDLKQNHLSLIPYVIEEAHEVADAIRHGNDENLCDELGDLLLQVVIHAQIANEEKRFCFEDIAKAASEKMIRRHPHVFKTRQKISIQEVAKNWEKIKQREKNIKDSNTPISDELKKKVRSQSPFNSSISISRKSLDNGFDWNKFEDPWQKINEDISNLKNALESKDQLTAENKIGSVIFSLINLSNLHGIKSEEGIIRKNNELLEKLQYLESNCKKGKLNEANQSIS